MVKRSNKSVNVIRVLQAIAEYPDRVFRPEIGEDSFEAVLYSRLAEVVADNTQDCKKKTYNNITSAGRTAFTWGNGRRTWPGWQFQYLTTDR